MISGIGFDNMIKIKCDRWTGNMIIADLEEQVEKAVQEGKTPFFVNCMA